MSRPQIIPSLEGKWWEDNPSDQMYISFDHDAAQDLGIKINDTITLSIYGREVTGTVKNFPRCGLCRFYHQLCHALKYKLCSINPS